MVLMPDKLQDRSTYGVLLERHSDALTERERLVIGEYYGLGRRRVTMRQTAETLNVGVERVRQIRATAQTKLLRAASAAFVLKPDELVPTGRSYKERYDRQTLVAVLSSALEL